MNVIILGPPGSGKGTQAQMLVKQFNIPHISTGDMFRAAIGQETELGLKVRTILEKGQLVPDEITIGIVKERLAEADCGNGFLLDGFPRTIPQAYALADILEESHRTLDAAINIEVPDDVLIPRMTGRRVCRQCGATYHIEFNPPQVAFKCDRCSGELYQRSDDSKDTVADRLAVYARQTQPLIMHYAHAGVLKTINGNQSPMKVFNQICSRLRGRCQVHAGTL
ncbi:MAG TPA: adenylate kinase [Syntrophomonas sp.]|nr:adenylate kinase [Syntrophomonas sp.]